MRRNNCVRIFFKFGLGSKISSTLQKQILLFFQEKKEGIKESDSRWSVDCTEDIPIEGFRTMTGKRVIICLSSREEREGVLVCISENNFGRKLKFKRYLSY